MKIILIRTDRPEAEIALYSDAELIAKEQWHAHRQLAETLHVKIHNLLKGVGDDWKDIEGIGCYQGPGSFTGLRIGLTTANALAYGLKIPIVAMGGDSWQTDVVKALMAGKNQVSVQPYYGREAHITQQKK